MKRLLFFFIALFFGINAFSQNVNDSIFRPFGKTSVEDFNSSLVNGYSDYGAVVLVNEENIYFDIFDNSLKLFKTVHKRIRFLNDSTASNFKFNISFSGCHDYENVLGVKVIKSVLSKNKVSNQKIKKNIVTFINKDSLQSIAVINVPELKKDDILDLQYTVASFEFVNPPEWNFYSEYPVMASRVTTSFPDFINYQYIVSDNNTDVVHTRGDGFISLPFMFNPADNPQNLYYMVGRQHYFSLNFRFRAVCDTFKVYNVFPPEEAPFPPVRDYGYCKLILRCTQVTQAIGYSSPIYLAAWRELTHLLYVYADADNRYLNRSEARFMFYNSAFVIVGSDNWYRLYKRLRKSPDFWKPIMKAFKPDEELFNIYENQYSDSLQLLTKLYDYLRFNVKFNGKISNSVTQTADQVLKRKSGTSADINAALVCILRRAGFDAFPAAAATRDFGLVDTSYASMYQFNTLLCAVRLNNELFYIDATDAERPYYVMNSRNINNLVFCVTPDNGFLADMSKQTVSKDLTELICDSQGCIFKNSASGNIAFDKTRLLCNNNVSDFFNNYYNFSSSCSDIKFDKQSSLSGIFSFECKLDITAGKLDNPFKILLKPSVFVNELRDVPVDFIYPRKYKYIVRYPKGMLKGEDRELITETGLSATLKYAEESDYSTAELTINIDATFFETRQYSQVKQFFDTIYKSLVNQ